MQDEFILQLLPMLMAGLALLIAMGKAWVGRVEAQTEQETTATQIGLLRQEIENLREQSDLETRSLVNQMMQRCLDENHEMLDMIKASGVERAELLAKVEGLRVQLENASQAWNKQINE